MLRKRNGFRAGEAVRGKLRFQYVGLIVLALVCMSRAQEAAQPDQTTVQQLVEEITALRERVAALESQRQTESPISAVDSPDTLASVDKGSQSSSLANVIHEIRGIQWRGFGELDYKVLDQRTPELGTYGFVPGSHGNFYVGDFDLLLTSRINDKTSVCQKLHSAKTMPRRSAWTWSVCSLSTITTTI